MDDWSVVVKESEAFGVLNKKVMDGSEFDNPLNLL